MKRIFDELFDSPLMDFDGDGKVTNSDIAKTDFLIRDMEKRKDSLKADHRKKYNNERKR